MSSRKGPIVVVEDDADDREILAEVLHAALGFSFEKVNTALEPFYRNHVNYSALLVFTVPLQIAAIQLAKTRNLKLLLVCIFLICCGALYFSYARGA